VFIINISPRENDPVDRDEFELLRDLPNKEVTQDIVFRKDKNLPPGVFRTDQVRVENALDYNVVVEAHFTPLTGATVFNFFLEGTGPICRFEVNSTIHGDAGRTHKHDLRTPRCPSQNLPNALARPDFEGLTSRELWGLICRHARIIHTGQLELPGN
jgi:hypothetical protein